MIGTELEMDGGEVAKLRIWKEKDFNITEFFRIRFVFLWNKACCFIIIRYLCTIYRISWISASFYRISCISASRIKI